jgi:signal transduction histidine kinase
MRLQNRSVAAPTHQRLPSDTTVIAQHHRRQIFDEQLASIHRGAHIPRVDHRRSTVDRQMLSGTAAYAIRARGAVWLFPCYVFGGVCNVCTVRARAAGGRAIDKLQYFIGALLMLQTILVIALLVQNRRHSRARADAQKQYSEITHAARLALVGEITASVAHEVTQPLSAILNNIETAEFLLSQPQPNVRMVMEILADVRHDDLRANGIVRRLRTLLRKRELQFEQVDVNALASSVLSLVMPDAVRRSVVIRTSLQPELPRVSADPVHLQQVLLNLIINAMDAMNETPLEERVLDVRTERCDDDHLMVGVLDHGHGISQDQKDRLFDSFYTTKNEGLGLGLSIARSIINLHGGAIWAENRPEGGAAFVFTVPVRSS